MILITGFAPYDGDPINASASMIEAMRARLPEPLCPLRERLALEVIDWEKGPPAVESRSLKSQLEGLLEYYRPTVCLFTGQARGETAIRIERVGLNFFMTGQIESQGPVGYWSTLPDLERLPRLLTEANIPARHSNYAGAHLCNHILYSALHRAQGDAARLKAGFVHIPLTPAQTIEHHKGAAHMPTDLAVEAMTLLLVHIASLVDGDT